MNFCCILFAKNRSRPWQALILRSIKGECFCLLGPNGAGKTTLIKVLSTLVLPNAGKAFVNGLDVEKDSKKIRGSIGFAISEERSFYWRLTGRQNLEFYLRLNNIPRSQRKAKVEEVLALTQLAEAVNLSYNTYSTGMSRCWLSPVPCL